MHKTVYVNTSTMRGILYPDKKLLNTSSLLHNDYLNDYITKLFNTKLYYFGHHIFSDKDDIMGRYTPIVVKLIITNTNRSGIYLIHELDKNKVSIPGGHISKEDVLYIKNDLSIMDNGLLILQEALCRELYEEFYGNNEGSIRYMDDKNYLNASNIQGLTIYNRIGSIVTSRFGIPCSMNYKIKQYPVSVDNEGYIVSTGDSFSSWRDPELTMSLSTNPFYLYKGKERQFARSLTFYYVMEIDCSHDINGFIWLDKEDFRLSCRKEYPQDMFSILGTPIVPIARDIRFSDEYRPILKIIFNTMKLF